MNRQQKRAYNANRTASWTVDMKNAWKEEWKRKTASWNKKKGVGRKAALVEEEIMGEEAPMEQPRPKRRKRNELERLQENLVHV